MRLNQVLFVLVSVLSLSTSSIAGAPGTAAKFACQMIPPNTMRVPIRPGTGQIPEMIFRQYLQTVAQIYAPLVQRAGQGALRVIPNWASDDVNAGAWPSDETVNGRRFIIRNVEIFGGLARHPAMTGEGLVLAVCHEIGHHLGGFPRYSNSQWAASTEGQSDYFATSKCAREVFGRLTDNEAWFARAVIPMEVRNACQQSFPQSRIDAIVCMRSSAGGLALANVLQSLDPKFQAGGVARVNFAARNLQAVATTFEGHPEAQCRLDTYVAGAICQASAATAFSATDERQGACTPEQRMTRGFRPSCWFAARKI